MPARRRARAIPKPRLKRDIAKVLEWMKRLAGEHFEGPTTSVTRILEIRETRAAWREALPHTSSVVRQINAEMPKALMVPWSAWTRDRNGRAGVIGNAYDYATGSLWAGSDLESVWRRIRKVSMRPGASKRLTKAVTVLETLFGRELQRIRQGSTPSLRYYRILLALAELDAIYRAGIDPPPWATDAPLPLRAPERRLVQLLASHFGDAPVEIEALARVTQESLLHEGHVEYNPVFGGPALPHLGADGDIIVGNTLIELKVSIQPFTCLHVWQVLCYAMLDRLHGRARIRRVGLFNPRKGLLWAEDVDVLVCSLGGHSFDHLCRWFSSTAIANGRPVMTYNPFLVPSTKPSAGRTRASRTAG
jgi:hypothetical protein